ncbi:hypothetical protein ACHAXR_010709 [Thalassiosira sp. AJA248-18]
MISLPLLLFSTAVAITPVEVHSFVTPASSSNIARGPTAFQSSSPNTILELSADSNESAPKTSDSLKRRKIIQTALVTPLAITSFSSTPQSASAASEKPPPIIPLVTTAKRLHAVPTFTIVDGNGVPFHTYDKDSAGGFGYFFTSYTSAEYVLEDAQKAFAKAKTEEADKKLAGDDGNNANGSIGDDGQGGVPDAWGQAQIVTLPLDVVMQLSVRKLKSVATNAKGRQFSTFYQVIPETEGMNAALRIENSPRYSERGRVPLFYADGLTLPSTEEEGAVVNPVYFRVKDLKAEWERQHQDSDLPTVKVRELNETFRAMIRPGGKDKSVTNLVFVPIQESVEKAKTTGRKYKLGEMILTK